MGSTFLISVAPGDALPLYRQIVEQVKAAIASSLLVSGDQLPSHRDLAKQVLVAPLTVKRAYDVLEQEGFAGTRRGRGTFVTARGSEARSGADAELHVRVRALVRHARVLGLSERELLAAVRTTWRARRHAMAKAR